jgi:hypothetical protein
MRLEQAVLAAVGEIWIGGIGERGRSQFVHLEDDEMVVQHANAGNARRRQRPGRVEACLAG